MISYYELQLTNEAIQNELIEQKKSDLKPQTYFYTKDR